MPATGSRRGCATEAEALNQPLLAAPAPGAADGVLRPLTVEGLPVALAGLKPAEDGAGLILRVYEPAGARGVATPKASEGWRVIGAVDLLERPIEVDANLRPFEVRGWRLVRG